MTANLGEMHRFTVENNVEVRLDVWLTEQLGVSRSQLKRLVDRGLISVNGNQVKAGYFVKEGDEITVMLPRPQKPMLEPQSIPLDIVYEDEELVVINKPKNLVVHPGAGNFEGTLVNALLAQVDELAEGSEEHRPGIVHRLDKDTSGLMVVAKTNDAYEYLVGQIKDRLVERQYLALVHGVLSVSEGCIDEPIGRHPKDRKKMAVLSSGRPAKTLFRVEEYFAKHSLVRCRLVTGRTHQIRVHFAKIHHPVVGDMLYGFKRDNLGATSQVLHATFLAFEHPRGERMEFQCPPDEEFMQIVDKARQMS